MSFDEFSVAAPPAAPTLPLADAPQAGFAALGLARELLAALEGAGYTAPTDVQAEAVPAAIAGADLLVSSRTGSGKTAAFMLPALERVLAARRDPASRNRRPAGPRVLVLVPTRELAAQVTEAGATYGRRVPGLRIASVVGGVPYGAQVRALRGPLDVLVATPGRLIDLMQSNTARLDAVELLVLDEADRMLDLGFIDDISMIAASTPSERQTLMFSATFGGHVGRLARELTRDPRRIALATPEEAQGRIEQRLYWADGLAHRHALLEHLLTAREIDQAVVFTRTQRDADLLAERLADIGHPAAALHGGMPQGRRTRVLTALRQRRLRVLVATDVAARGIDVPSITHVINDGLPMKAEDYVHRIGRTGRAGRDGVAMTLAERRELPMLRRIERFTAQALAPSVVAGLEPKAPAPAAPRPGPSRGRPGAPARRAAPPRGRFR